MIFLSDNTIIIPLCHDYMPLTELCEELRTMAGYQRTGSSGPMCQDRAEDVVGSMFQHSIKRSKVRGEHCSIERVVISTEESHLPKLQSVGKGNISTL